MSSKAVNNILKKLVDICHKNNVIFLEESKLEHNYLNLQYGPLGTLLKRNIFNEWFAAFVHSNVITVYPSELLNPRRCIFSTGINKSSKLLVQNVVENYLKALSLFNNTVPFGFAVYGTCLQDDSAALEESECFLGGMKAWSRLSVIFFYPRKKPMNWFYYWSKQRYLWWRKYSSVPSHFSMSEIEETPGGDHRLSVQMSLPPGASLPLEVVTLLSDDHVREACGGGGHLKTEPPSVVTCEMELDLAVVAYLVNSMHESWREDQNKNVFRLHPRLAPYQVSVSGAGRSGSVADHLQGELRGAGVRVLPASRWEEQEGIQRLDEMGVPYSISLNEDSLQYGIAELRNRDTTLMEQIHITELSTKLAKYLKL